MKIRLKTIRDLTNKGKYMFPLKKGDIIDYIPWYHKWRDMSESERVDKGIFVHCHGHGSFEVFYENKDVMKYK